MDNCAHCGARVPADAIACPSCGSTQRKAGRVGTTAPARSFNVGGMVVGGLVLLAGGLAVGTGAVWLLRPSPKDSTPAAPPAASPGRPVAAAPAPPAVAPSADSGFAGVRARGKLRVAADPEAPPFLSRTATGGWEGFEFAVISAIATQAKVEAEIVPAAYDQLLDTVRSGAADLAIGQLAPTPESGIAWSLSYLQYDLCLVVAAASTARTLRDLPTPRTIGMYDDRTTLAAINATLGGAWSPRMFNTFGYFDEVARGALSGFVYDCPLARHELRGRTDVRIADDTLGVGTYAVAFPEREAALRREVDEVLVELGGTGLLGGLAQRWLSTAARPTDYTSSAGAVAVVRAGETLEAVAARALGSASRVGELRAHNEDILGTGGGTVYAGMKLRLP